MWDLFLEIYRFEFVTRLIQIMALISVLYISDIFAYTHYLIYLFFFSIYRKRLDISPFYEQFYYHN